MASPYFPRELPRISKLHLWVMGANALSTRFFSIFFFLPFFAASFRNIFSSPSSHRAGIGPCCCEMVWSPLGGQTGLVNWIAGISCVYLHDQPVKIDHLFCQCSYNHSDLETSRREHARVGCTFLLEHGTSTTHSFPPSPYIPHSGQTRQSPPHPLRSRMCIPSFARSAFIQLHYLPGPPPQSGPPRESCFWH